MHTINTSNLIKSFCTSDDMSTYDPYDIWQTNTGILVKNLYNNNKYLGIAPAGIMTLYDMYLNNRSRLFYRKKEYPIVRALATQSLLNLYHLDKDEKYLQYSRKHITWLIENSCKGYSGYCWGLSFRYPVLKGVIYTENTPLATMTPYVLEALHQYYMLTKEDNIKIIICSIFKYLECDLAVMYEDESILATSYGPLKDRTVINALSYTMYSYALLYRYYLNEDERIIAEKKINKLYAFIKKYQSNDGSWLYSIDGGSFIDCFHSCFVVKNIIKTNKLFNLPDSISVIDSAYEYIKKAFYDEQSDLYLRFSKANKIGLVKLDLYDNAEMMSLAILLSDFDVANKISDRIKDVFFVGNKIYSQIIITGGKINQGTLRWAIMPLVYAHSLLLKKTN